MKTQKTKHRLGGIESTLHEGRLSASAPVEAVGPTPGESQKKRFAWTERLTSITRACGWLLDARKRVEKHILRRQRMGYSIVKLRGRKPQLGDPSSEAENRRAKQWCRSVDRLLRLNAKWFPPTF